jgi:hypothetical protein
MNLKTAALAGFSLIAMVPAAYADNTDTGTVTVNGTIIAPLTITGSTALTMPDLVKPTATNSNGSANPSGGTTAVTVACGASDAANTVTYTAGGNPYANGTASATAVSGASANLALGNKTGTCATVAVSGQANYNFQAVTGTVTQPTTAGVTISAATCANAGVAIAVGAPVTLSAAGIATIQCGAKVTAATNAVSYADGKFDVTVTYD